MRTGAEYLVSLNDGRDVWVGDERIDNVATHSATRGYANAIAQFYDLHYDPVHQDATTFVDESGRRQSMQWFVPRTKDELKRRRRYYETVMREVGHTAFSRMPDSSNALLLTYIDDPEPWESQSVGTEGRGLMRNIAEKWTFFADNDLFTSAFFVDPQTDRGSEDAMAKSPALRVVEQSEEGIVVNGAKAIGTSAPFANWIHLGVFFRPGIAGEQVIFGVVPVNAEGLTIVCRENKTSADASNHPLAAMGDELDGMAILENVFIPWTDIFHLGNPQHALHYPQRVFDWHHYYILVRAMVRAELMAGLATLMAESIGTWAIPEVKVRLARFFEFRTTLTAHVTAAEDLGFETPGGQYKPDMTMVDFGRAHYLERLPEMVQELLDLCGRSAVLFPSEGQWNDEKLRRWLEPMNTGPTGRPYERVKIARVVHDLFLTDWGTRQQMFDNFQATPLRMIRFLTMMRQGYAPDSEVTSFARQVCGIESGRAAAAAPGGYERRLDHGNSVRTQVAAGR
jgi:aromatic ring hydroxylase